MKLRDIINETDLDTDRVWYHGTLGTFKSFDVAKSSSGASFGPGVYLTNDPDDAYNWARAKKLPDDVREVHVFPVRVKGHILRGRPLDDKSAEMLSKYLGRDIKVGSPPPLVGLENRGGSVTQGAKAAGFAAVEYYWSKYNHLVVTDPKYIERIVL